MRIGIDAHILAPEHKRYSPQIAAYTRELVNRLPAADPNNQYTVFVDMRMPVPADLRRSNVEIRRFPFVQYRRYLPFLYSHMLISAFLSKARLDVFHSPEGLIPITYPGKTIATFHTVPRGEIESNFFMRTMMLGARAAFSALCQRAYCIVVNTPADRRLLIQRYKVSPARVVLLPCRDLTRVDWNRRTAELIELYRRVAAEESLMYRVVAAPVRSTAQVTKTVVVRTGQAARGTARATKKVVQRAVKVAASLKLRRRRKKSSKGKAAQRRSVRGKRERKRGSGKS